MAHHLEEPHDGQVAHVSQQDGPLGLQVVASETEDVELPRDPAQLPDELGCVQVSGRLATGNQETRSGRVRHFAAV